MVTNTIILSRDIQKATRNFTTIIGEGSFGPVYKAIMPTSETVAVKVLANNSKQGEKEFQTEVQFSPYKLNMCCAIFFTFHRGTTQCIRCSILDFVEVPPCKMGLSTDIRNISPTAKCVIFSRKPKYMINLDIKACDVKHVRVQT